MAPDRSRVLADETVPVRLKISALWVAMLLLFAYGDIFGFFVRGRIDEVTRGEISGIETTQGFLLAVSLYVALASLMVFLTLVLRPSLNRRVNIVLPILYAVSIVASVIGEDHEYFFLSGAEVALLYPDRSVRVGLANRVPTGVRLSRSVAEPSAARARFTSRSCRHDRGHRTIRPQASWVPLQCPRYALPERKRRVRRWGSSS